MCDESSWVSWRNISIDFTDPKIIDLLNQYVHISRMRAFGSAQMSLCLLAMGSVDGIQVEHLGPWDVAAGSVIVTEAGGTILDVHGNILKERLCGK